MLVPQRHPHVVPSPRLSMTFAPPLPNEYVLAQAERMVMQIMSVERSPSGIQSVARRLMKQALDEKDPALAHTFLGLLHRDLHHTDVLCVNQLLTAYKKMQPGALPSVLRVMQQMHTANVAPDGVTFNIVVDTCGKAQELFLAFRYFGAMRESGLVPTVNTYTSLIDACGKARQLSWALWTFDQMPIDGVQPNAFTFTTMIQACCSTHDFPRGIWLLQRLVSEASQSLTTPDRSVRSGTTPDSLCPTPFTMLIRALATAYEVEAAFEPLYLMLSVPLIPDPPTLYRLVTVCMETGHLARAVEILVLMGSRCGMRPNKPQIYQLIEACALQCEFSLVSQVLSFSASFGSVWNLTPCHELSVTLVHAVRAGAVDVAFMVLEVCAMSTRAADSPTAATFVDLVTTCCSHDALDRALMAIGYMHRFRVPRTVAVYCVIIERCTAAHIDARQLYNMMREHAVAPMETKEADVMIRACMETCAFGYACEVLLVLSTYGVYPRAETGQLLICACASTFPEMCATVMGVLHAPKPSSRPTSSSDRSSFGTPPSNYGSQSGASTADSPDSPITPLAFYSRDVYYVDQQDIDVQLTNDDSPYLDVPCGLGMPAKCSSSETATSSYYGSDMTVAPSVVSPRGSTSFPEGTQTTEATHHDKHHESNCNTASSQLAEVQALESDLTRLELEGGDAAEADGDSTWWSEA